jgi:hypothetical protein
MLQEKPSALKREHPVLKNMKILDFLQFLWVIFALLDPDPATQINADPDTDPDPKPCWQEPLRLLPVYKVIWHNRWPAEIFKNAHQ